MIVRDKKASIVKANEVASKIITMILQESESFIVEAEPAENIYLAVHIVGNLISKICMSLEGFGKIYAIPNMNSKAIKTWIDLIAKEHLKLNN